MDFFSFFSLSLLLSLSLSLCLSLCLSVSVSPCLCLSLSLSLPVSVSVSVSVSLSLSLSLSSLSLSLSLPAVPLFHRHIKLLICQLLHRVEVMQAIPPPTCPRSGPTPRKEAAWSGTIIGCGLGAPGIAGVVCFLAKADYNYMLCIVKGRCGCWREASYTGRTEKYNCDAHRVSAWSHLVSSCSGFRVCYFLWLGVELLYEASLFFLHGKYTRL